MTGSDGIDPVDRLERGGVPLRRQAARDARLWSTSIRRSGSASSRSRRCSPRTRAPPPPGWSSAACSSCARSCACRWARRRAGIDTTRPGDRRRHRAGARSRPSPRRRNACGLPRRHQPVRLHAGELRRHRPLADHRRGGADRRQHLGRLPRRGAASPPARRSTRCGRSRAPGASSSASRASCSASTRAATRPPATIRCCARCSSTSPTADAQDIVGMLRTLASAATFSRRAEVP